MDHAIDRVWEMAQAPDDNAPAPWLAIRAHFAAELEQAALVIGRDPDVAAVALDGLLWRMLGAWYAAQGEEMPARGALLADLEWRAPALARRLRLALRAPDVGARLAHCRQLLGALDVEHLERVDSGDLNESAPDRRFAPLNPHPHRCSAHARALQSR